MYVPELTLIFQQANIVIGLTQYMVSQQRQDDASDFTLLYSLGARCLEISEFYGFFQRFISDCAAVRIFAVLQ